MTIKYEIDVIRGLCFLKGSIYSLIWKDLLFCIIIYYLINFSIRFGMSETDQIKFIRMQTGLRDGLVNYDLLFILGFFLDQIYGGMWGQLQLVTFTPSKFTHIVTTFVRAGITMDKEAAQSRRICLVRWLIAMTILSLRRHSSRVQEKFPTVDHLAEARILTIEEAKIIKDTAKIAPYGNWWQPSVWIHNAIDDMTNTKMWTIHTAGHLRNALDEYRMKLDGIMNYQWSPLNLPYVQLVTLATLFYFLVEVFAYQMIPFPINKTMNVTNATDTLGENVKHVFDYYVPVFLFVKLLLFCGVLRICEVMMDPFGSDADDFETEWILEWHLNTSYLHVGPLHGQRPPYDHNGLAGKTSLEMPHTKASQKFKNYPYHNQF